MIKRKSKEQIQPNMTLNLRDQSDKIKHLYWRAGFGLSPQEWQARRTWSVEQAVEQLFTPLSANSWLSGYLPEEVSEEAVLQSRMAKRKQEKNLLTEIVKDWVLEMGRTDTHALVEKMTLFWHGHFACSIKQSLLASQQLSTLRTHALGSFRTLLLEIAKDPAMIRYLNNQQNRKNNPNENFARELLELFTIGRGHYTEADVKSAARAFTGWSSTAEGGFVFRGKSHDFGRKTFLGQTGNFNGEDIIDIILARPATAEFITRKIYRYFVNEQVDEQRLKQLADTFYRSDYNIGLLMRTIFLSDWFYEAINRGNKIKSPVVFMAGLIRHLQLSDFPAANLLNLQKAMGQILLNPPNVAGWPGGKSWIDNSTLMLRLQLAGAIFQTSTLDYSYKKDLEETPPWQLKKIELMMDFQPLKTLADRFHPQEPYETFLDFLLPPNARPNKESLLSFTYSAKNELFLKSLCVRLMSLPEYQLC